MSKYTIILTDEERQEVLHVLAHMCVHKSATVNLAKKAADKRANQEQLELLQTLWHRIRDTEPEQEQETPRTCGECAHFVPPKSEVDIKRQVGGCPIYARSEEFKKVLENHDKSLMWSPAPGRCSYWKACQHFTPKTPEKNANK